MKRPLIIFFLAMFAACSSIKTSFDYDKNADFTKFRTYDFAPDALNIGLQELNRNRLLTAVEKELASRGFTKSSNHPDVLIDLMMTAQRKESATATTTGPGMYGYGRPYMYGGGFTTTQINVNQYIEGTLFINMVADNKLVWQGRGTGTLDEDASPEQRERNINNGVNLIFKKYPVQPTRK